MGEKERSTSAPFPGMLAGSWITSGAAGTWTDTSNAGGLQSATGLKAITNNSYLNKTVHVTFICAVKHCLEHPLKMQFWGVMMISCIHTEPKGTHPGNAWTSHFRWYTGLTSVIGFFLLSMIFSKFNHVAACTGVSCLFMGNPLMWHFRVSLVS